MNLEKVRTYVNQYIALMDAQLATYETYARQYNLTAKELFVLYLIWFAGDAGCLQSEICERLSITKQTTSAIVKKFWKLGYLSLTEAKNDRRNKVIRFTPAGVEYAKKIIPPAADAENHAMSEMEEKDITELVRLTEVFSDCMKKNFDAISPLQK